jgi:hypothetical protein
MLRLILSVIIFFLFTPSVMNSVHGGCIGGRSYSTFQCVPNSGVCMPNSFYSGLSGGSAQCGATGNDQSQAEANCRSSCQGLYGGNCAPAICLQYDITGSGLCLPTTNALAPCSDQAHGCVACSGMPVGGACPSVLEVKDCVIDITGYVCTESNPRSLSCAGADSPTSTPTSIPTLPPGVTPAPTTAPSSTPTTTPIPPTCGVPPCNSFGTPGIYINDCTPQIAYTMVPRSTACQVDTHNVTLKMQTYCANQMSFIETNESTPCNSFLANDPLWSTPETIKPTKNWVLNPGNGPKKVCVKYINTVDNVSNQCGGIIEVVSPVTIQTGTVEVIPKIAPTCLSAVNPTNYLTDTSAMTFTMNASIPKTLAMNDHNFVSWTPITDGSSFTIASSTIPLNYALLRYCWTYDNVNFTADTTGSTKYIYASGNTLHGYAIFGPPVGWLQSAGGDVYANTTINTKIPDTSLPQNLLFSADLSQLYPGIISYGNPGGLPSPVNFSLMSSPGIPTYVSKTGWLAENHLTINSGLYNHFFNQVGNPVTANTIANGTNLSQTDVTNCTDNICFFDSGVTIQNSDWAAAAYAQKRVVFVRGNLSIQTNINIANGGFLAFIVSGSITVSPSVGNAGVPVGYAGITTTNLDGVYIADGIFNALTGGVPDKQLIGKGIFVADSFNFTRSLGDANNVLYPATLFVFNPRLLFDMPDVLREVPYKWEEVAP